LGDTVRARLPARLEDPALFVLKHLWAGLFGGVLMLAIAGTTLIWQPGWPVARYDALFVIAFLTQVVFAIFRLESREEGAAVIVFSLLGLGLEWFNTAQGSWTYPEEGVFAIGHVPLFVGFMYAAVGVCILRMIRIFEMRFAPFPMPVLGLTLGAVIYANFFLQHYWHDIRPALFLATLVMFWRTRIWFTPARGRRWHMPMLASLLLSALGVWLAENLGTLTGTWAYQGQARTDPVSLGTYGSWYLFLCVALMVALLVMPQATAQEPGDHAA
jgi:uncharacterized membrane protein YoaT (DUF817 family)